MKSLIKILIIGMFFGIIACESENENYALKLIDKVEEFKKHNGRLPNNVAELGFVELENSLAFYEKKSDSTCIVWYGVDLGESKIYDSQSGKWN